VEVTPSCQDSVSCLAWHPTSNVLAAGSWDKQLRIWQVQANGQSVPKLSLSHDGPILCCAWSGDGGKIFSGGCDNKALCLDIGSQKNFTVAQHQAPIKTIFYVQQMNVLCTGSWDKTLCFWDGRQSTPALKLTLPERIFCQAIRYPVNIVITAPPQNKDKDHVFIYDLHSPQNPYRDFSSPLHFQSRCVSIFADNTGFAQGSIAGRVAIHHVKENASNNFTFKCHRDSRNGVYAVNSIAFHPEYGTFATAGSDGCYMFWDKDSKMRLFKPNKNVPLAIPCAAFNYNGSIYAYASSYDWSKGYSFYDTSAKHQIFMHPTSDGEIKQRKK